MIKNIILIGSGNVSTQLGISLHKNGLNIIQVWSKNMVHAQILAKKLNCVATDSLSDLKKADLYIVSVKDNKLKITLKKLNVSNIVHTSGSIKVNVFSKKIKNYGVVYPLQTINKEIDINFKKVPFCIEASNQKFESELVKLSKKLSNYVYKLNSIQREKLHIAAVIACNFTNHMYKIAHDILTESKIDFEILLPLINQTVLKIHNHTPDEAQTGPAKRKDMNIIDKHIKSISDTNTKNIYKLLTKSIIESNNSND